MRSVPALRVLAALDGADSFSAAADALGMTQSAVSQHVASLERHVGLRLVERGTRPVDLTAAGRVLAGHAAAVGARLETAALDLAELAGSHHRRLRLGGFPTALATFVPPALSRVRQRCPEVRLSVLDDHAQGLLPRLLARELDVAVLFTDAAAPGRGPAWEGVEVTTLFRDAYRLLLPPDHRLVGASLVALADLAEETWVGGSRSSTWFEIVRGRCRAAGFDPRVGVSSDDHLAVQAMVAAGLGVAVVPGLVTARRIAAVEIRDLTDGAPARVIHVASQIDPYRSRVVSAAVEALVEVTARHR